MMKARNTDWNWAFPVLHGAATEKVRGDNAVRKALQGGMSSVEAFDTYGIM